MSLFLPILFLVYESQCVSVWCVCVWARTCEVTFLTFRKWVYIKLKLR